MFITWTGMDWALILITLHVVYGKKRLYVRLWVILYPFWGRSVHIVLGSLGSFWYWKSSSPAQTLTLTLPKAYGINTLTKPDFQCHIFQLICFLSSNSRPFVLFLCYWHYRIVTEFRGTSSFNLSLFQNSFLHLALMRICVQRISISVSIFIVPSFTTFQLEQ